MNLNAVIQRVPVYRANPSIVYYADIIGVPVCFSPFIYNIIYAAIENAFAYILASAFTVLGNFSTR